MFITVEGIDGCGKTTQLKLLAQWLTDLGLSPLVTREPGGTPVGESIRELLLAPGPDPMTPQAEVLLYAAARAELVTKVIRPALARGQTVLSDRFSDSTLAYQVAGRGLKKAWVEAVLAGATGDLTPDLTLLFDLAPLQALARSPRADRIEQEDLDFFARVRDAYLSLAVEAPGRIVVIPADRPVDEVQADVRRQVAARLKVRYKGGLR